jgi:transposase
LCNAHHLRELKALIELDGEAWATPMRDTLIAANAAVRKARDSGASALAPDQVHALVDRYWEAVREGLAFHRALPNLERSPQSRGRLKHRPGFNLLTQLKTFKDDVLRFLVDFDVPFTNNLAEQDIRMTKVKMKISGAFRTLAGAKNFACLRSIVSTARKQGYDILQTLAATPDAISQAILE